MLPKPGILINLALSELYAGHELEALSHLEQYLADPSVPAEKRDRAQRALDEAMKKTSHLAIKSTAGAEVRVDGKLVSLATAHVMPGTHALEARAGDKVRNQSVDVKAGEKRDVDLSFDAPTQPVAVTPPPIAPPPPGGDVTPPPKVESDEGSIFGIRSVAGGVLFVAGGVMLGVGLAANGTASDAKDKVGTLGAGLGANACNRVPADPKCAELASNAEDYKSAKSRAITLIPIGIVGLGGGALLFASSFIWKHKSFIGQSLIPQFAPGLARLDFTTSF